MLKTTSARIAVLRFPLICGVVLIHNYSTTAHLSGGAAEGSLWMRFAHLGISTGVAALAVPLFYLISGFLFFVGFENLGSFREKLVKRGRSLLIPFIFWNLIALTVYGVGESFGGTARLFSSASRFYVPGFHAFDYLNALIGITGPPIAYQFWFIRDLMALVLLTPVLLFLFRRGFGLVLLGILAAAWFGAWWFPGWPKIDSVFYFSLGAYLSYANTDLTPIDRVWKWAGSAFAISLFANIVWFYSPAGPYIHRFMVVSGIVFSWWLVGEANRTMPRLCQAVLNLGASSFFVFAAHEPLLTIFWKLSLKKLGNYSGPFFLVIYFLIPTMLVTLLVLLHRLLQFVFPSLTALIAGEKRAVVLRTVPSSSS